MPIKTIFQGTTERMEILDHEGSLDEALMPDLSEDRIRELYRNMNLMRAFDDKAIKLQRQGRMGTWAPTLGQEAAQAGLALALKKEDWLAPTFRESGLMLLFGVPAVNIYAYWKGDEKGSLLPEGVNCLPPSVPIASQMVHAAGIGMALKKKGLKGAAVGFGGDGATSEGDFHEALNFAAVFKAQTLFYVQNNQWAISVPVKMQTASATLAQKALAYGMPGLQVDGNDVFAVYRASMEALESIRNGGGPRLIEAVTFRLHNHTTADDQSRYRTPETVEFWKQRDPIKRLREFLMKRKLWDDIKEAALQSELSATVEGWVAELEARPAPDGADMVRFMYKEMPWFLKEQEAVLMKEAGQ